jgi:hypothetical protein
MLMYREISGWAAMPSRMTLTQDMQLSRLGPDMVTTRSDVALNTAAAAADAVVEVLLAPPPLLLI